MRGTPALLYTAAAATLALGATPSPLHAYAEDVCFFQATLAGGEVDPDEVFYYPFNCYDLECLDGPEGASSVGRCAVSGLMEYLSVTLATSDGAVPVVGHSSVHFDATYVFARIAGLSAEDALALATYDQATDLGVHRPLAASVAGSQPRRAELGAGNAAQDFEGLRRDNADTDGFAFHFVPWRGDGGIAAHSVSVAQYKAFLANRNGTNFDEIEAPLVHLRDWAWATGGQRQLCKLGLVAADGSCASDGVFVHAPLLGDALVEEGVLAAGWQSIVLGEDGTAVEADTRALSGTTAAFGAYLHTLGDRVSHDACLRQSPVLDEAGTFEGESYEHALSFDGICGQVTHALRHYLETGHATVTPPRTTIGLNLVVRELAAWATAKGLTPATPRKGYPAFSTAGKLDEAFLKRMVGTPESQGLVTRALGEACAGKRLQRLCEIARDGYGIAWYDGNAECRFPTWPGDTQCR